MQGSPRRPPNSFRAELLWDEKFNGPPPQSPGGRLEADYFILKKR